MKLSFSSFTILVALASFGAISANDWHRVVVHSSTTDWKQVVSIVKPLLTKALMEHGDGSIASNAKASQAIDNYIDLTRFVASNEKFAVTNVLDSGIRVDEQNGVETLSSFLTLSCICADYECDYPVAMDRDGVIDKDKPKYIGKTPLLFLDSDQKADCLSIFQLSSNEMVLDNCDLDGTRRNESDYLYVKNCTNGQTENLRIKQGNVTARPLNASELLPDNMENSTDPSQPISVFLQEFEVPEKVMLDVEVDTDVNVEVEVPIHGEETITIPIEFTESVDIASHLEKAEKAMIKSVVHTVGSIMLPETFHENSSAADATIASYFRILMDFSIRRMRKPLQSNSTSSLLSGDPLYLDLIASRPETSALAEIISGDVLLAITAGTFGWFVGVKEMFQLFLASCAFGAELAAFVLRWKAEVALEDWNEDMVLVDTTTGSRNREIPLALGRDGNPITVSITMARLSSSEDRATEMGFLIAGAIIAGISLFVAAYMGYKEKTPHDNSAVAQAGKVAEDSSNRTPILNLPQVVPVRGDTEGVPDVKAEEAQSSVSGESTTGTTATGGKQLPPKQSSVEPQPLECASLTMSMDCSEKSKGAENENAEASADACSV